MDIPVIYEDNDILAVNKPAGTVTHRANLKNKDGDFFLTDWLAEKFPEIIGVGEDPLRPGVVHRLDKDTSGVLIVAKNQNTFEYLKSLFHSRKIIKKYIALVEGNIKNEEGTINMPIGRSRSDFRKKIASEKAKGYLREAITEYNVMERLGVRHSVSNASNIYYTLVEAYPKTGRTHQIRVHLKAIGHPIVCDSLYGGRKMFCPEGLARHFLHANFLEFTLPGGSRIKLEADLPQDLEKVLEALRKNK